MVGPFLKSVASYVPALNSLALRDFAGLLRTGFGRAPHEADFAALEPLQRDGSLAVLDVGANRGQSIRSIRSVVPSSIICAVEPNPALARYLERRFPEVEIHNVALGAEPGELELFVPSYGRLRWDTRASGDRKTAQEALGPDDFWRFRQSRISIEMVKVPVKTVDQLEFAPDVIKVDTEGMELDVIKGGLRTIERHHPILMVEGDAAEVARLLKDLGYLRYYWEPKIGRLQRGVGELNTFLLSSR